MENDRPSGGRIKWVIISVFAFSLLIVAALIAVNWKYIKAEVCFYAYERCCERSIAEKKDVRKFKFLRISFGDWSDALEVSLKESDVCKYFLKSNNDHKFLCAAWHAKKPWSVAIVNRFLKMLDNDSLIAYDENKNIEIKCSSIACWRLGEFLGEAITDNPIPSDIARLKEKFKDWKPSSQPSP